MAQMAQIFGCFVTTKVARLETAKTRSHKGTKKRKSFEILGALGGTLWMAMIRYISIFIASPT
jgi:hypothetical protein